MTAVRTRSEARWTPKDALSLLRNAQWIRRACNPFENERWWNADARTTGADNLVVAKEFGDRSVVERYAEQITKIINMTIDDLNTFVQTDPRMKLLVKNIDRDRPWDEPTGRRRPIVIPTILRRCLSNLVASVLETTTDHLLPNSAVAYRPGKKNAVTTAIIDVASNIHFGQKHFYWKYDLRNAFPSLPWPGVADALIAIGYEPTFVEFVIALVRAPLVRKSSKKLLPVPNRAGCQAGLPESALLLNIFLKPLDEELVRTFPQLTYARYADDGGLVEARRHIMVGAVRRVLHWAREHHLDLKGVSPDQGAQSLVQDIRETPLHFLGAVIEADGNIRIPPEKIDRQIRKLRYRLSRVPADLRSPARGVVVAAGWSKYRPGAGRGRCTYDLVDVQRSALQFFSYAFPLNEGDAMTFLRRVQQDVGINVQRPPASFPSLVWVAALGDLGVAQAGGLRNLRGYNPARLRAWFLDTVERASASMAGAGDGAEYMPGTGGYSALSWKEGWEVPSSLLYGKVDTSANRFSESHAQADDVAKGPAGPMARSEAGAGLSEVRSREVSDDCLKEGECSLSEGWSEEEEMSKDECISMHSTRFFPTSPDSRPGIGADRVEPEGEPPIPGYHKNVLCVHLLARRVARRDKRGGTIIVVHSVGTGDAPRAFRFERMHEDAATVAVIRTLREDAAAEGHRAVLVLLDDSDLPKQLLQRDRAFRTPPLFARILELHAPHEVAVVLAGCCAPPTRLRRRLEDEVEAYERSLPLARRRQH